MLTLDYSKIANWQDVCQVDHPTSGERVDNPFNLTMGVFMMHTGIQRLTHKNASEFYMRAKLIEACCGSLFTNGDGTPRYLTTDDVYRYIGLASNVSSYTEAQFFAHLRKDVTRSLKQAMEYMLRSHEREVRERVLATIEADPELRKLTQ